MRIKQFPARVAWAVTSAAVVLTSNIVVLLSVSEITERPLEGDQLMILTTISAGLLAVDAAGAAFVANRQRRPSPLSPRELEIVGLIARGLSTKEIASRLVLSPKTVDAHRVRIHRKLGVHDRVALTRLALERGWLNDSGDA